MSELSSARSFKIFSIMPEGTGGLTNDAGQSVPVDQGTGNGKNEFFNWMQQNSSALLSAGSGIVGTILNWLLSRNLQTRQHEFNMQDWEANNEYNLPANQYQRLIDAGVSPAAAAQALTGVKDASLPSGTSAPAVASMMPDLGQSHQIDRTYMLSKSEAESRIALNSAYEQFYKGQALINEELRPYMIRKINSEVAQNYSSVFSNQAMARNYNAVTERINKLTPVEYDLFVEQKKECIAKTNELSELAKVHKSQADLNRQLADKAFQEGVNAGYEQYNIMYEASLNEWKSLYRSVTHSNPDDPPILQWLEQCAKGENGAIDVWDAIEMFYNRGLETLKEHPSLKAYLGFKLTEKEAGDLIDLLKKRADLGDRQLSILTKIIQMAAGMKGGFTLPSPEYIEPYSKSIPSAKPWDMDFHALDGM